MVGCVSGSKTQFITSRLNHYTKIIILFSFFFFYNSLVEVFIVYANIKNKGTCEINKCSMILD